MIDIIEKKKCTGCAACAQICPQKCISMKPDKEGFLYPAIDSKNCIECGLCERTCPVINTRFVAKDGFPEAFLIYDNDDAWRKKSAAGGGFAAIARAFLDNENSVVFGATYDENYRVYHTSVDSISELPKLQKSKYVQSQTGDSYKAAKEALSCGKKVLYSGTPCQIYGLKRYLGEIKETKNLYCIDLSCHGVPSPKVFSKYLEYLEENAGSKIVSFTMRDKRFMKKAYRQGFGIVFENGKHQFISHSKDLYGRCFWGEIASRPSCYDCHFKTIWRTADITLGDCWFMNCFIPQEKDSLGVTLALAHSDKGSEILKTCKFLTSYVVPAEELIKANGGMIYSSAEPHPQRAIFFKRLDEESLKSIVDDILPPKKSSKKQMILNFLNKFGIRVEFLRKRSQRKRLKQRLRNVIPDFAKGEMI